MPEKSYPVPHTLTHAQLDSVKDALSHLLDSDLLTSDEKESAKRLMAGSSEAQRYSGSVESESGENYKMLYVGQRDEKLFEDVLAALWGGG